MPGRGGDYENRADAHDNSEGKYLEALIHLATICQQDSHGAATSGLYSWEGPYSVSADFAAKAQDVTPVSHGTGSAKRLVPECGNLSCEPVRSRTSCSIWESGSAVVARFGGGVAGTPQFFPVFRDRPFYG
jgi:hypothetical protein